MIATTRVVDLDDAERLLADGQTDVIGMTRAMIADPDLISKAVAGRAEVLHCIGCNQGCIGHYHAGTPIACVVNPRTGRERTLPRPIPGSSSRDVLVIGGGPAGIAAAVEARCNGDRVTLLERGDDIGGQLLSPAARPRHRDLEVYAGDCPARPGRGRRRRAPRHRRHHGDADGHDLVVVATGARPFRRRSRRACRSGVPAGVGGDRRPRRGAGPVLVADWGGGYEGLDAAELLAAAGLDVELASAAWCRARTCTSTSATSTWRGSTWPACASATTWS